MTDKGPEADKILNRNSGAITQGGVKTEHFIGRDGYEIGGINYTQNVYISNQSSEEIVSIVRQLEQVRNVNIVNLLTSALSPDYPLDLDRYPEKVLVSELIGLIKNEPISLNKLRDRIQNHPEIPHSIRSQIQLLLGNSTPDILKTISNDWTLQIVVSPVNQDAGFQPGVAVKYKFDAWLSHNGSDQELVSIYSKNDNDFFRFSIHDVGKRVHDLFNSFPSINEDLISTIEFFLPTEKLHFEVEQASHSYYDEFDGDVMKEWVFQKRIVIRSQERAFCFPSQPYSNQKVKAIWKDWEAKSRFLKDQKKSRLLKASYDRKPSSLPRMLENKEYFACGCIGFACDTVQNIQVAEKLFRKMILYGLPALFWFRPSAAKLCNGEDFYLSGKNALFQKGVVLPENYDEYIPDANLLAEKITKIRQSPYATDSEIADIGNHIALFWDKADLDQLPGKARQVWKEKLQL